MCNIINVNFFTSEELNPVICPQVKMLRVLEKARPKCAIEISSTFCGAHSVPKGSTAAEVCSHQVYFLIKKKDLTLSPREVLRLRLVLTMSIFI